MRRPEEPFSIDWRRRVRVGRKPPGNTREGLG